VQVEPALKVYEKGDVALDGKSPKNGDEKE
jgi:hypothetical protein